MEPAEPITSRLDYDDYASIPYDGRRWELLDGELEVNPASVPRHQTISRRLQYELMGALEESGLAQIFNAPIDLILSKHDVFQPDLVIVSAASAPLVTGRGIEGVPEIVVEILSPSTRHWDERVKRAAYERFRIPEYWIVDPDGAGRIDIYEFSAEKYRRRACLDRASRLRSPLFPTLDVELLRVFRD